VLVVDDDFASLRLMEAALRELGYEPIGAGDGEAGLSLAQQLTLDFVVLDLLLPGIDGFKVLEELRQHPRHKEVPVIVWTIKDLTPAESQELAVHTQAVLMKGGPDQSSLLAQLSTVLPKHPA
jgi:threonine synthase